MENMDMGRENLLGLLCQQITHCYLLLAYFNEKREQGMNNLLNFYMGCLFRWKIWIWERKYLFTFSWVVYFMENMDMGKKMFVYFY